MKFGVATVILITSLLLAPLTAQAKTAITNGSFEKNGGWECSGCDALGVDVSWVFAKNVNTTAGKRAAYLVPTIAISQVVTIPQKSPAVGLTFLYHNTGSFRVQAVDTETGEEYVNEIVESFAGSFTEKSYTLPGRSRGRSVRLTFTGLQYTSYLDRVRFKKLSYPIAGFTVVNGNGEPLDNAKVWFQRNGKTRPFRKLKTKETVRSLRTNETGTTGRLRVLAPPQKTKICARIAGVKQCSKLYDVDSFDYGTDAAATVTLDKLD